MMLHSANGKRKLRSMNLSYLQKDARTLGEVKPAPSPPDNKQGWTRVKEVGESPENIKPNLKPYSVEVIESGYAFLQSTRHTDKTKSYDDIEWG